MPLEEDDLDLRYTAMLVTGGRPGLRGARAGDLEQPLAQLLGIGAEVVEPRQLGKGCSSPKTRSKSGVAR